MDDQLRKQRRFQDLQELKKKCAQFDEIQGKQEKVIKQLQGTLDTVTKEKANR